MNSTNWGAISEVFLKSIRETLNSFIWKFFLRSAGAVFLLLFGASIYWDLAIHISILIGLGILLVVGFIRFCIRFFINTFKKLNEIFVNSSYGEAIICLKDAFSKAHYYRKNKQNKAENSSRVHMECLMEFCEQLKNSYENITNSSCAVSIKVPLKSKIVDGNAVMMKLCRDPISRKLRDTEDYKNTDHPVLGNTAFRQSLSNVIGNKEEKFYLNNHVSQTEDYESTSKECRPDGNLGYESEIVYPIIPIVNDNSNYDCLGFLCIDCEEPNAFNNKYDVAIAEGSADGIYDLILERRSKSKPEI